MADEDPIVSSMLEDLAAGKAVPNFPTEPTPIRTRKPRSDAGVPRGPRNVPIDVAGEGLPVRGRRTRKATAEPISKKSLADIIEGAHKTAGVMISDKAGIKREDAERIADAMAPVIEDYGIVLASKVVHLVALAAVVVAVEGPIVASVIMDQQDKARIARERRNQTTIEGIATAPPSSNGTATRPVDLASILGVEAGGPNVVG